MEMKFKPRIPGEYKLSEIDIIKEVMANNLGKSFWKIIIDTDIRTINIDLLVKILNSANCICKSYKDALYINELVTRGLVTINGITLEDDLEMKDRSYIDLSLFKNVRFMIPFSYYMWGVKNINNSMQKSIYEITRIVSMISEFPEKLTDVEKIILVVNYIQNYCEYINSKIDILNRTGEQFEIVDNLEDSREVIKKLCHSNYKQVGSTIDEPLFENYATCSGFANLLVLLLNNPYIKIRCEKIHGDGHAWNAVILNGKYYNIDVTRSITYSPYRAKNNLKTLKFNKEYILVGTKFLQEEGHEKRQSILGFEQKSEESIENFDSNYIDVAIEHLKNTGLVQFEYANTSLYPRVSSKIK